MPEVASRSILLRTLVLALSVLACRPAEPPQPPERPALHASERADVAELCDAALHSWSVLDEVGEVVAITRGRCLGRLEHPEHGPTWHFVAQLQPLASERSSWELHVWLDAFAAPRDAELRTPERITRFAWRGDTLEIRRLGDLLELPDASELWVVPDHALYLRELMLRLGVGFVGPQGVVQRTWSPERDGITSLELELLELDGDRGVARTRGSVINELALVGVSAGLAGVRIAAVRSGGTPRYEPRTDDRLAAFLPIDPRPEYRPAPELELVAIEIPAKGEQPRLAGELVLPRTRDTEQRLPAVLFLAGAGPQDRHGLVPNSSIDIGSHEIHDALALAGFAVLRVDDRGVGASEIGDDPAPGFRALVDDGRRALAWLAQRPEIDPTRIILIGHGEGALHAMILAAEGVKVRGNKRPLAGLILLAAPGRALRELIYDEMRVALADRREAEIRMALQRAREVHDAALSGGDLPASSAAARTWMVEAFTEDPLARLRAVKIPVLVLQGGKDFQVSPERDFGPLRSVLEARSPPGEAQLFDDLDHLFKLEPTVSTPGHYADLSRHVAPEVLVRIVEWSLARAQR